MKKILIDEALNRYRANLHCHTTMSDGKKTPEEIKEFYKSNGYAAVAYTDHNVLIPHNDLTDPDFVALTAIEYDFAKEKWSNRMKTCHICMIAPNDRVNTDPLYNKSRYAAEKFIPYLDRLDNDDSKPGYERTYSHEGVNDAISKGRAAGFFVTYNHPTWSLESYPEYSGYEGMNAMEIVNYGCYEVGYDDVNKAQYADLLNQGKRIYCLATDDNHNRSDDDTPYSDSFGGYVMICADVLSYDSLFAALEAGNFYSVLADRFNKGPEIKSIAYEDGKVYVKASAARNIRISTGTRASRNVIAMPGETVTEACFTLMADEDWFRITVTDQSGYEAYSNAYFVDELREEK